MRLNDRHEEVDMKLCEAGHWQNITGQQGQCPNPTTHTEYWFDEEALPVELCDDHEEH